jgi:hypothetical protein
MALTTRLVAGSIFRTVGGRRPLPVSSAQTNPEPAASWRLRAAIRALVRRVTGSMRSVPPRLASQTEPVGCVNSVIMDLQGNLLAPRQVSDRGSVEGIDGITLIVANPGSAVRASGPAAHTTSAMDVAAAALRLSLATVAWVYWPICSYLAAR